MYNIGLSSSIIVGMVFLVAGANKVSSISLQERALALLELLLGVALFSQEWPREIRFAAFVLAFAYLVFATSRTSDYRCSCFGSRLPTSSRTALRWRNALLAIVALIGLVETLSSQSARSFQPFDIVVALAWSAAIMIGPWLLDWASGSSPVI